MQLKRRKNGTGTVVFLGKGRYHPYAARILIGKDLYGKPLYYDIDTFEEPIDALVCLENYHKNPTPLKIKQNKYDKIAFFPKVPYPLVPVDVISSTIHRKNKRNYTFKQVFEEMKENLFPTKKEMQIEKEQHIKPGNGKFALHNSLNMTNAYNHSEILYDKIYRELRTSDFQSFLKGKTPATAKQFITLFKNMDKYAYNEDIIDKKYTDSLKASGSHISQNERTPFSYEQIDYLWNIQPETEKEELVKDILLLALYTGCRAEELFFLYTKNIHLGKNYFVGGIKTANGINREIPIHPAIIHIIEKYYNKDNEFLFMKANGKRLFYGDYNTYYRLHFKDKHEFLQGETAHCGRHTLETELQRLNVKPTIINSIMGHKNGNVGSDTYNHISIEEKIEAIKLVTYKSGKIVVLKNIKKTS